MSDALPRDDLAFLKWAWEDFEPFYTELMGRTVTTDSVDAFLRDWTRLDELLDETFSRLHVATTVNTGDHEAEGRYHAFLDGIYPRAEEAEQKLKTKLLELGIEPEGFAVPLRKMRTEAEIFRESNLPLFVQEHKLSNEYDRLIGGQTVQWDGKELTIAQLRPLYKSPDRTVREASWRKGTMRQLADREAINGLWRSFLALRQQQHVNADFSDYRSFRWKLMSRFDYTPEDCRRFHEAIERAVVPAAARICERRRAKLGVPSLRPWDLDVDPLGRPPLAPFREVPELTEGASRIFHRVDPILGGYFDTMIAEGLLDLDNRKNKAPGGYCTEFAVARRPFIFMNAVGIHDDVQTLLHEAGHSFHVFERAALPYGRQRDVGMEFSEVASMGMELLAMPYLPREEGGFYTRVDAARAITEHLEWNILFWPYMAVVDAFQHWVYEHHAAALDPAECDRQWTELSHRFMPFVDWSGLEEELKTGWHRKLHIHQLPFYYVEYGLALLGAVQVWEQAITDQAAAVARYRRALSLGGTVSMPELFAAAGARFAFGEEALSEAVRLMEGHIERLQRQGVACGT